MSHRTEYIARRGPEGCTLEKLTIGDGVGIGLMKVPIRHDLRRHSQGFEFGYAGSGPAQTALAILADCIGDEKAQELYQRFKRDFVAPVDGQELRIAKITIELWVAEQYRIRPEVVDEWKGGGEGEGR